MLRTKSQTPRLASNRGNTHLGTIAMDAGEHLDFERRVVDIEYKFGGTEIEVVCKHQYRGEVISTRLKSNG